MRSDVLRLARAEKECPKTFPGIGTTLTWIFNDPRGEDVLEDEMLGEFRRVRNEIELKIKAWLEHPEDELRQLTQQRERERWNAWSASVRRLRTTASSLQSTFPIDCRLLSSAPWQRRRHTAFRRPTYP